MPDTGHRSIVSVVQKTISACSRFVAAPQLAVASLVTLAGVLVSATWLESQRGHEWVHWKIYSSVWFTSLLGFMAISALISLVTHWSWRFRDGGRLLAHGGLLLLLLGATWTRFEGTVGELVLGERQTANRVADLQRTQITIERVSDASRRSSQFAFTPGAEDWPKGKMLEFAETDGVALRVLEFYRRAQTHVDWVAADRDHEGAAVRLAVVDLTNRQPVEEWLTGSTYGGELYVGAARFVLWPLYLESMVADFLDPPTDLGTAGVISVHYQGRMHRFRIDDVLGENVPLADSGASVEILEYFPDAKPQPDGRKFVSRSNRPKNPVVELRVRLPNEPEPIRQLAFAKSPLLNLDGVLGRVCPVRFWYHHADVPQQAGVVFAQTPAGTLHARRVVNGKLVEPIAVQLNESLNVEGLCDVSVVRHIPQARRDVTFTSLEQVAGPTDSQEAAVRIEVSVDGTQRMLWLSRGENEFSYQTLVTSAGLASVICDYQQLDLEGQLELAELKQVSNSAIDDATFNACVLNVRKTPKDAPVPRSVTMNRPLRFGTYRVCLTGFRKLPQGQPAAVLTVSNDPGRPVTYLGCVLILCGLAMIACGECPRRANEPGARASGITNLVSGTGPLAGVGVTAGTSKRPGFRLECVARTSRSGWRPPQAVRQPGPRDLTGNGRSRCDRGA